MARNWKIGEAVAAIKTGAAEDKYDIGHRFPLFTILTAQINEPAAQLLAAVPDYVTVRKMEAVLKGEIYADGDAPAGEADADEEVEAEVVEKPAKRQKKEKTEKVEEPAEATDGDKYDGMSARDLFDLCKKRSIECEPKKTADTYAKLLKKADAAEAKAAAKPKKEEPADDAWGDEDEEEAKPVVAKKADKKKAAEDDDEWDI